MISFEEREKITNDINFISNMGWMNQYFEEIGYPFITAADETEDKGNVCFSDMDQNSVVVNYKITGKDRYGFNVVEVEDIEFCEAV